MPQTQTRPMADQTARASTLTSILVHVESGSASSLRVEAAARLAREFDARLIGLGAEALDAIISAGPYSGIVAAERITQAKRQVEADLETAEQTFRRDAAGADIEWRSTQDFPGSALARNARGADLIVVGPVQKGASGLRTARPGDVIIASGRPVLIVPEGERHLRAKRVVIGWKDTREARRAVSDALPFLLRAEDVMVLAVCAADMTEAAAFQVNDVVTALKRKGVAARSNVTTATAGEVTSELERIAALNDADLIVIGAYGHNRLTEWVFGGVTNDLLHTPTRFVLMSH